MTTLQPPAAATRPPGRPSAKRDRRSWTGWGFIGPFAVVFAFVFLAPIAYSIYLSLFRDQLIGGNHFVGLDNYKQAFQDDQFWSSLERVSLFLVIQVPIMLGIALFVALALDSGLALRPGLLPDLDLPAVRRARRGRHPDVGLHVRHPVRSGR